MTVSPSSELTPKVLKDYCSIWCEEWKAVCSDDEEKWIQPVQAANIFINKGWIGTDPSPFKRASAAAMAIVTSAPLDDHLPDALRVEYGLTDVPFAGHPKLMKAIVGDAFARYCLIGAEVGSEDPPRILKLPIKTSSHFRKDVLWLLTQVDFTNGNLMNPLSLIYEACAYQTNTEAQDKF